MHSLSTLAHAKTNIAQNSQFVSTEAQIRTRLPNANANLDEFEMLGPDSAFFLQVPHQQEDQFQH